MTAVPPEAVEDAAAPIAEMFPGLGLETARKIATVALEAAAPHIRAQVYAELGNDHYVIFTEDGWTTEHSVECRLSGHMHECAIHSAIAEWAADDPRLQGRWRIVSAEGPVPVLERADLIPGGETNG